MALRVAISSPLTWAEKNTTRKQQQVGGACVYGPSSIKASSLKQKPKRNVPDFCFETAVEDLERMFRNDPFHPVPQRSGPHSPTPSFGFSGRPVRVAYQGVRGSYCQEAAIKAFSSISCNAFPCHQMEDAFQSLEENSADLAIIPVENSIDGSIDRNFDLLLRHQRDVEIVRELILPVNHCLLSLPGTSMSRLKHIVSHPQALSHCKSNLQLLDLVDVDEVANAADAAMFVSENKIPDTAVIGSKIAAKEFGLQILQENFQDPSSNFNRFLQLRLKTSPETTATSLPLPCSKTTVAFSLNNGVSDLFRALWAFESRNVTVNRVEHRPNRLNPVKVVEKETGEHKYFDYVFILDLSGHVSESALQTAISQLGEISGFVCVLGSYTCDSISC